MSDGGKEEGGKAKRLPPRSVLLVLWCRVIFSYNGEQRAAVEAITSAAAPPFLTATSLSQQRRSARDVLRSPEE